MKIAVSSMGNDLEGQVDPRFGRCQRFIIVDPDTMKFEVNENSGASAAGGAGIATAQAITGKGVEVILTGHCGPNAFSVLEAAGVKVMTNVSGSVRQAVESYKQGKYQASEKADTAPHSGMGGR